MKTTRNLWPTAIIGTLAVFLAGTIGLVVMACSQRTDLVSPNYYEQEIQFQSHLDRLHRTQNAGLEAILTYQAAKQEITIALPAEQIPQTVTGQIQFYRPSAAHLDRNFKLEPGARGVQSVTTKGLLPGLWKVRVSWTVADKEYFLDQRVVIQ